jgi:hypothetical protein
MKNVFVFVYVIFVCSSDIQAVFEAYCYHLSTVLVLILWILIGSVNFK